MSGQTTGDVDSSPNETLTLAEAAERLGVHYMTAYRYVRLGQLDANKVGTTWTVSPEAVTSFSTLPDATPLATVDAIDPLVAALVAGDEDTAWSIVEPIIRTSSNPETIHLEVIAPAMAKIGEQWAAGQRSIADEHRATTVARRLLGRIRPTFRSPGRRRGLVVVAAPTGDHHSLPSSMFSDLVRAQGPDVIDLGAETSAETLLEVADRFEGRLVICLTLTHETGMPGAMRSVEHLRERYPDLDVLIGGHAITTDEDAKALGATAWRATARDAAAHAAELAVVAAGR